MYNVNTFMNFNGVDFSDYFVVEGVERTLLPGIRNAYAKSNHMNTEILPTVIAVRIRLIENDDLSLVELKREVAGLLYTDKPAKLVLYDDPTRYDMAKLDGSTDFSKLWTSGSATLKFICAEGLSYSDFPRSAPIGTVHVGGTRPTKPVFTITFASIYVGDFIVSNATTGKSVTITGQPFSSGAVLVIDCQKQLVTLNGNPIMPKVTLYSDFFTLNPGNNILTSTKPGTVAFNEAWL